MCERAMQTHFMIQPDYPPRQIRKFVLSLIDGKTLEIEGVKFNGRSAEDDKSLYTVLSVLLPFKDPMIGLKLDMKGIAISQGSACSSGASKPSMVLMMILDEEEMQDSTPLRVSFSHLTTREEIDALVTALKEIAASFKIENTNVSHR